MKNKISLILVFTILSFLFVSCDPQPAIAEEPDKEAGEISAVSEDLVAVVNRDSDLVFDLLREMTEEELKEHYAEKGSGCYTVKLGSSVYVTYADGCVGEEYECEYRITHYPDESDKGWFVTGFSTNNPYTRVCGVAAGAEPETIRNALENRGFSVNVSGQNVEAVGKDITVRFAKRGEKDVSVNISVNVTNKTGIVY